MLTDSGITALQAGDFHDLPNVNELHLDRNDLESLPDDVFDGLDGLRRLRLNDNDLATLPKGAFDGLDGLRRLYLNDNDLDDLPDGAFDHLESLRRLRLNDNDLSELPDGVFDGLTGLRELWLHSNPGAPFNLTAELERRSDTSVVVRVAQGAPFDIEVTLSVTGVDLSATTVTIRGGSTSSDEITMIPDGDGPVTVSVTSAALRFKSDQGARGIQVRAGDPLTLTEGEGGNTPAAGEPTISGTVRVGETLTADTSGISDADGLTNATFNYQWLADDADIAGAIGLTYILIEADEDKAITVQVSFTDDRGHQETLTSSATAAVAARPNSLATGAPTISGTAQVGETLTADISGIADADGLSGETFSYQWVSSDGTTDTDIEKATDSTYKLVAADQGKAVKVRVTFTDDGGNEETLTSAPTAPVWGDGLPGAPRNLTATPGNKEVTLSWDPPADNGNAPATRYRIEWRVDGKDYDKNHWGTARSTTYTTNDQANLANGVKYFFRVKAENGSGNSYGPYGPASEEVSATPTSGSAVDLGTPVLSDTENLHHGMVRLDWQDIEDAGWYVVQYYHLEDGEWLDLPAAGSGHRVPRFQRGGEQPAWALVAAGWCGELRRGIGVVANRGVVRNQRIGLGGSARTRGGGGRRDRTMPRGPGHAGAVGHGNPASRHGEAGLAGHRGRRLVRGPVLPPRRRGVAGPARRGSGHRVPRFQRGGEQPAWALVAAGWCGELRRGIGVVADRGVVRDQFSRTGRVCPYPRWRRATRSSHAQKTRTRLTTARRRARPPSMARPRWGKR